MKSNVLAILVFMPMFAGAAPHQLTLSGGTVEVLAIGKPSFIKIRGKGEAPSGALQVEGKRASGKIEFELATLDTGIGLRNEHMRDKYLHVKEHPKAKLEIQNLDLPKEWTPAQAKLDGASFTGKLNLHGVIQDVKGTFTVGEKRDVTAEFKIKLTDYKIDIPEYLGVKVADEVTVSVRIDELKPMSSQADVQ